jgi:hypothetical protein
MLVKVCNDNVHPYREKWRGQDIYIEPKGSIKMDLNDANLFLGTMPPNIEVDANNIQKPTSYKMLRIEKLGDETVTEETKTFKCMMDGKEFQTQAALDAHIAENFADDMIDDKAKKKLLQKKV